MRSRRNWNLEVLVLEERATPQYPEQTSEPTANSTHIYCRRWDTNPDHIGGRRMPSALRQSKLPPIMIKIMIMISMTMTLTMTMTTTMTLPLTLMITLMVMMTLTITLIVLIDELQLVIAL